MHSWHGYTISYECEADHSCPSNAKVKNAQSYTSIHPRLHGVMLSQAKDTSSWHDTLSSMGTSLPLCYDFFSVPPCEH